MFAQSWIASKRLAGACQVVKHHAQMPLQAHECRLDDHLAGEGFPHRSIAEARSGLRTPRTELPAAPLLDRQLARKEAACVPLWRRPLFPGKDAQGQMRASQTCAASVAGVPKKMLMSVSAVDSCK